MRKTKQERSGSVVVSLAMALAIAASVCVAIDFAFRHHPTAGRFLAASERVYVDAAGADRFLDELIERGDVTWDPTNGEKVEKVLMHLRRDERPKVLLVGSSQMLVVRDDRTRRGIDKRVDRVLEELLEGRAAVYNLSLGGMTLAEKRAILERAIRLMRFDRIVVALTAWDSESDQVRESIRGLPARVVASERRTGGFWSSLAPRTINRTVTARFESALGTVLPFFARRTAIREWLVSLPASDEPVLWQSATPVPVQYTYTSDRQSEILDRVDLFLQFLGSTRATTGAEISVLLTPFRQDASRPAYAPPGFYDRYRDRVRARCAAGDLELIDASTLLGPEHFGIYEAGRDVGRIDVLHFDAQGHRRLADLLRG